MNKVTISLTKEEFEEVTEFVKSANEEELLKYISERFKLKIDEAYETMLAEDSSELIAFFK